MKIIYKDQNSGRSHSGLQKLSLLLVMMLFGFTTAFAQTQLKLTIECHGRVEVFDRGSGTTVTTIQGPVDESTITVAAGQLMRLRTVIPTQITSHQVTEWEWTAPYVPGTPNYIYTSGADFIDLVMGANGTVTSITASFEIRDPNITITDYEIESVTKTPVIMPVTIVYDDPSSVDYNIFNDPIIGSIMADLRLDITGGFPANTEILKISKDGGATNLLSTVPTVLTGAETEIFLYDILTESVPTLFSKEGITDNYEFTFAGIDDPAVISFTITVLGYADKAVCYSDFVTGDYELTFADAAVVAIDDFAVCHDECIEFDYDITYPAISNVDARIKNDAKINLYKSDGGAAWDMNSGAKIEIYYNSGLANTYTLLSDYNEFYLSALLNNVDPPTSASTQGILNDHNGLNDQWSFKICDANPGNYYVEIENFAQLETVEYGFEGDEFLLQYVGALGVSIDAIDNIETATNAPVVFEATVNYPQTAPTLADQNLDADLLVDALITVNPALPVGTTVAEIQYNGSPVTLTGTTDLGGVGSIRLSQILGSAPTLLSGHVGIASDTWKISIENLSSPKAYTVTIKSVTSLDFNAGCSSVMAEEDFTVTTADLVIGAISDISSITKTPLIIPIDVQYPTITPYDNTIMVDARISTTAVGGFPASTKIIGVSTDAGVSNLIASPYDVSGMSSFLLSTVLGTPSVKLIDEDGNAYNWEILVISETVAVTDVLVESIVNYPLGGPFVLDAESFQLTYADVNFADIADATVCDPDDVVFGWTECYPLVENVGGTHVLNDAKITIWADAAMTIPRTLQAGTSIGMNGPGITYSYTFTSNISTIYGSALATQAPPFSPNPTIDPSTYTIGYFQTLERPATVPPCNQYEITITGAQPGNFYVKIEDIAMLDWDGNDYNPPTGSHGTFEEYVYKTRAFKILHVGADDVSIDAITDIETVTNAPVIFEATVNYPQAPALTIAQQNVDPTVLADALISFSPQLPAGTEIVEIRYNGTVVSLAGTTVVGGMDDILLSAILGTAPTTLLGHSAVTSDTWKISVENIDAAGAYNITLQSVAYVDFNTCYSVMAEKDFTVTTVDLGLGDITDVSTIKNTPFILPFDVTYPNITNYDQTITTDALISAGTSSTDVFPNNTKIIAFSTDGGCTNILAADFDLSGLSEVYLSTILGTTTPAKLVAESNMVYHWEFMVISDAVASTDITINPVVFYPLNLNPIILAEDVFTLTTALMTVDAIDDATVCHPDDIVYSWCESNPLVAGIDQANASGDYRIFNDSKFTFFADAAHNTPIALTAGTTIEILTPANVPHSITLSAGANTIYGSAVVSGLTDPTTNDGGYLLPLERAAAANKCWQVTIKDAVPGTIYVQYDHLALYNCAAINMPNYPPHGGTVSSVTWDEFIYVPQDFKSIYVGADNVSMADTPDISTVTGAPVIVPFTTTYGDLASQNIDPSVQADARFSTTETLGWPTGAKIEKIEFVGGASFYPNYSIAGLSEVFLSQVLGTSSPLAGHHNLTVQILATISGVNTAVANFTTTVEAVAWVDSPYGTPAGCYSPMASDDVDVTWADMTVTTTNAAIVCEGTNSDLHFDIQYPTITNNPNSILLDVVVSCNIDIPANTALTWTWDNGPSGTYTFGSALTAGTDIKFSDIITGGTPPGTAPNPLQGHGGLDIDIDLEFANLDVGVYTLDVVTVATLGSTDYNLYDSHETPVIEVYEVPDATITGPDEVFSGAIKQYSVAAPANGTPSYSWTASPAAAVSFDNASAQSPMVTFIWGNPMPYDDVVISVVVGNGVCSNNGDITVDIDENVLAGQVKYYNSQESPMPSPFMVDFLGIQVPGYFRVELYSKNAPQTPIEEVMVQEIYGEVNDLLDDDVYEAAFMFDYNLDPTEDYFVAVYDAEVGFFASTDAGYWTMNNWGGVTAVDALFVQHMAAGNQINGFPNMSHIGANILTPAYGFFANGVGDVNSSGAFTALDALLTSRRAVGLIPFFTNNTPNFRVAGKFVDETDFNTPAVFGTTLPDIDFQRDEPASSSYESVYFGEFAAPLGVGVHFLNIYYNATGDVNSSYVPAYGGFKAAPVMDLIFEGEIAATVGQEVTLPITLDNYTHLGAMGLGLNYRNDLIEVIGTSYGEDYARIDHENGTVAIAWADINGVSFDVDDAIVQLTVRILQPIAPGTRLYELNGFTELAEVDATIIYDVNFKSIGLNTSGVNGDFTTNVYPNPFNQQSVISYTLPEAGKVNVTIFNKLGQVVTTMVSESQAAGEYQVNVNSTDLSGPGMYYYKVEFDGETQHLSATNNMILIR